MHSENGRRVSSGLAFLDATNVLHGTMNSLTSSSTNVHVAHYTDAAVIVV